MQKNMVGRGMGNGRWGKKMKKEAICSCRCPPLRTEALTAEPASPGLKEYIVTNLRISAKL